VGCIGIKEWGYYSIVKKNTTELFKIPSSFMGFGDKETLLVTLHVFNVEESES
jgi:hypothetical protein